MVFSSIIFITAFLPITFLLYYLPFGNRYKNAVLIAASFIFYAFGEPVYVFLMLFSALMNYLFGLVISKRNDSGHKGGVTLAVSVVLNVAILGIFKYTGFIVSNINTLCGTSIHVPSITLPIGISFFTFQAMSYVIDVYRNPAIVQKSFPKVLLYISFFPQLIAGPIVRYTDINDYLARRDGFDADRITEGLTRFTKGLAKKLLIANCAGSIADTAYALPHDNICALTAWLGAICYTIQIYYDFSGYSDMALGLSRVFGFKFPENFDHPYCSKSIKEFWRRWHISLSTWFKEYVYIPLGGNRKGKVRTEMNKLIVFFLTGLWHGAAWTFIIWGLYNGILLVAEDILDKKSEKRFPVLRNIFTCILVVIGFVFFRADTLTDAAYMIRQMFTGFGASSVSIGYATEQLSAYNVIIIITGIVCAYPLSSFIKRRIRKYRSYDLIVQAFSLALLALCILSLSSAAYNPFIYFRF